MKRLFLTARELLTLFCIAVFFSVCLIGLGVSTLFGLTRMTVRRK